MDLGDSRGRRSSDFRHRFGVRFDPDNRQGGSDDNIHVDLNYPLHDDHQRKRGGGDLVRRGQGALPERHHNHQVRMIRE